MYISHDCTVHVLQNYIFKTKVEELEEELHTKTDQVLKAFSRQNELELEIMSTRKDYKAALNNTAKLESDVCCCFIDSDHIYHNIMHYFLHVQLMVNHVALKSAKAELLHFQDMSKKLQNTVVSVQREIEASHKELEAERNCISALEASVREHKVQLDSATQELTKARQHLDEKEGIINELRREANTLANRKEETAKELQKKTLESESDKTQLKQVSQDSGLLHT